MLDLGDSGPGSFSGESEPNGPSDPHPGRDDSSVGPPPGSPRQDAGGGSRLAPTGQVRHSTAMVGPRGCGATGGPGRAGDARGPRPGHQGPSGSPDSDGTAQHRTDGSAADNDHESAIPSAIETATVLHRIAQACASGFMDPAQARATASILRDMNQVLVQQEATDRAVASAAAHRPGANGFASDQAGESADRPRPGAPRMVAASIVDAMLEVAMAHQPQLLRDLEPVLDDEQLMRVTEFLGRSLGPDNGGF